MPTSPTIATLASHSALQIMQFLKFEWRKVLIFILIFAFAALFFKWTYQLDWGQESYPFYTAIHLLLFWPMWAGFGLKHLAIAIVSGFANLFYWYVLASLLVFIYVKIKKEYFK